jgi:hypothetical protein
LINFRRTTVGSATPRVRTILRMVEETVNSIWRGVRAGTVCAEQPGDGEGSTGASGPGSSGGAR